MNIIMELSYRSLEQNNCHSRDSAITFEEEDHVYTIAGISRNPISVTTLIHRSFKEFNPDAIIAGMMRSNKWDQSPYYGMTPEQIKADWNQASQLGTKMHAAIEDYINWSINPQIPPPVIPQTKEFAMFLTFWTQLFQNNPTLRPYRTEWIVYDETKAIAGSIDCVLEDVNTGELTILDWKRSKKISTDGFGRYGKPPFQDLPDCNYSHYSLQLNFYRHMLETIYHKRISNMMLVILHPNQDDYICLPVARYCLDSYWASL